MILLATGDVAPRRDDPRTMFSGVRSALQGGDLVFGQLETCLSARGLPSPNAKLAMRSDPACAPAIAEAGYDVMSFAGNHCLDWGPEAFADTLSAMAKAAESAVWRWGKYRGGPKPVIVETNGVRVAFPGLFLDPAPGLLGRDGSAGLPRRCAA